MPSPIGIISRAWYNVPVTRVLLITAVLAAAHVFAAHIGRRLDAAEHAAHCFGGGMAVAYIFLNLLPELDEGHKVLGHAVHGIALVGFVGFSAAEHWIHRRGEGSAGKFKLRIALQCSYNWLLVYMLPEAVETGLGYALLLTTALGLHLISTDYSLRSEFPREFQSWGRWVLAAGLVAGYVTDLFYEPVDPYVADVWIALLAGFLLCNVFRDEAPDPSSSHFGWFIAGVLVFGGLSLWL